MSRLLLCLLALGTGGEAAFAESAAATPADRSTSDFGALRGYWIRPDGGYLITIRGADAEGKLDAAYANPNTLPFARAKAAREGKTITVFFELRAGLQRVDLYAALRAGR